jgi:hypothetical protein
MLVERRMHEIDFASLRHGIMLVERSMHEINFASSTNH